MRSGLHRPRLALHVHQTHVRVCVCDHLDQRGVAAQSGDVVDELGAELERTAGDLRLRRVDRQRRAGETLEHGYDARELLLHRNRRRTRPRRLATDVDESGTLVQKLSRVRDGDGRLDEPASVREAVGCDVENAHDGRPRPALLERLSCVSRRGH